MCALSYYYIQYYLCYCNMYTDYVELLLSKKLLYVFQSITKCFLNLAMCFKFVLVTNLICKLPRIV